MSSAIKGNFCANDADKVPSESVLIGFLSNAVEMMSYDSLKKIKKD